MIELPAVMTHTSAADDRISASESVCPGSSTGLRRLGLGELSDPRPVVPNAITKSQIERRRVLIWHTVPLHTRHFGLFSIPAALGRAKEGCIPEGGYLQQSFLWGWRPSNVFLSH